MPRARLWVPNQGKDLGRRWAGEGAGTEKCGERLKFRFETGLDYQYLKMKPFFTTRVRPEQLWDLPRFDTGTGDKSPRSD